MLMQYQGRHERGAVASDEASWQEQWSKTVYVIDILFCCG
jgi:hypothetical protein